jgi:hypothetical protein
MTSEMTEDESATRDIGAMVAVTKAAQLLRVAREREQGYIRGIPGPLNDHQVMEHERLRHEAWLREDDLFRALDALGSPRA